MFYVLWRIFAVSFVQLLRVPKANLSASLAQFEKLPSVSLVCLVSFLAYFFPPREVMSLQIWIVFRKVYQLMQSASLLLSIFVFLTPHSAHNFTSTIGTESYYILNIHKRNESNLKTSGNFRPPCSIWWNIRFYHRYIHVLNCFVKPVNGFCILFRRCGFNWF